MHRRGGGFLQQFDKICKGFDGSPIDQDSRITTMPKMQTTRGLIELWLWVVRGNPGVLKEVNFGEAAVHLPFFEMSNCLRRTKK